MVRVPAPHRPASAAPRLNQDFEGHGLHAPAPCDRGYVKDTVRPPSAPGGQRPSTAAASSSNAEVGRRGKKKDADANTICIYAHVREKVITIPCGSGGQKVFWLAATAVHRYLSQPHSYSGPFSHEMTPKGVLAEDGAQLHRTSRVCDELSNGDHVWIDVGDGAPISHVQSRAFPDRRLFEPAGDDEYQEQIGWRATEPDMLDEEVIGIDSRHSMTYVRTVLAKQPTFKEWKENLPGSGPEGLFDEFTETWGKVQIDDMPGSTSWMNDVKIALFHHFEPVKYVFSSHSGVGPDGVATMSLLEFWAFVKRCALTSPWCNLAKIDKMFTTKQTEHNPHDPARQLKLEEFMGALCRLSILRQKSAVKPDIPLPKSLTTIVEENILPLTPGFDNFDPARAAATPFTSAAVKQKLTIHETKLKKLFRKWATTDETRQTINVEEWLAMFRASDIMGSDMTEETLRHAFVVAMLGDHDGVYEAWEEGLSKAAQEGGACVTLIFPEFVEAILRAALFKFSYDDETPVDLKIHEICLLLIFGPAGPHPPRRVSGLEKPPMAGVERRVPPSVGAQGGGA